MRVVFDTNVLVSALLFEDSLPAQALFFAAREGEIIISSALVQEVQDVLNRSKFDRFVTKVQREDFILSLVETATLVEIREPIAVCRDPNDNMILEAAVNGNAETIMTGDKDLLVLQPFRGIQILQPRYFIDNHLS